MPTPSSTIRNTRMVAPAPSSRVQCRRCAGHAPPAGTLAARILRALALPRASGDAAIPGPADAPGGLAVGHGPLRWGTLWTLTLGTALSAPRGGHGLGPAAE